MPVGSQSHAVATKQCHENSLAFFVFERKLLFLNFKNALCTEFTTLSTRKTCLLIGDLACWLALAQFSWFWPVASYCHESQLKLDSLEIRRGVRLSPLYFGPSSLRSREKYLIFLHNVFVYFFSSLHTLFLAISSFTIIITCGP